MQVECLHSPAMRIRLSLAEWCAGCGSIREQGFKGDEEILWLAPRTGAEKEFSRTLVALRIEQDRRRAREGTFATPEEQQAVMELRAEQPDDIDILLRNLAELDPDQHRSVVADFLATGSRYHLEQVVEKGVGDHRRVRLRVVVGAEREELGNMVVLSGPRADVDDYLAGSATLEDIQRRWSSKSLKGRKVSGCAGCGMPTFGRLCARCKGEAR